MKLRGFRVTPTWYRTLSDIRFSAQRRSDHSEGQRVWGMPLDQAETVMAQGHFKSYSMEEEASVPLLERSEVSVFTWLGGKRKR